MISFFGGLESVFAESKIKEIALAKSFCVRKDDMEFVLTGLMKVEFLWKEE